MRQSWQSLSLVRARDAPVEVPFAEVEMADPDIRPNQAEGVVGGPSDLNPFFPSGDALGKRSQLTQGPTQVDTREHRGEARHTEALSNQVAFEVCHVPPEEVHCATVLPPENCPHEIGWTS